LSPISARETIPAETRNASRIFLGGQRSAENHLGESQLLTNEDADCIGGRTRGATPDCREKHGPACEQ